MQHRTSAKIMRKSADNPSSPVEAEALVNHPSSDSDSHSLVAIGDTTTKSSSTVNMSATTTTTTVADTAASSSSGSEYAQLVGLKKIQMLDQLGGIAGLASDVFASDLKRGISLSSLGMRMQRYGKNKLPPIELQTFMDFVKESLEDKTMLILIGSAVISLILGMTTPDPRTGEVDRSTGWIEGAAILISVFIVVVVSSINNFQKQQKFAELVSAETQAPVAVVREGKIYEVPTEEVVVGDLVMVYSGMALSFDAIMVTGEGYTCDESTITGEWEETHKSLDVDPFLISGTNIVDGCEGLGLVVAVGETSYAGTIAMAVRERKKDTPLQEQLTGMADTIGWFGLAAAVFTFVVLLVKELYLIMFYDGKFFAMKLFENITTAVAIVVVAVPEGLPLSVTISLAYSMKRMLQDNNLVRHLAACETMGGATHICSDKTGTLTHSDMRAKTLFIEGKQYEVSSGILNLSSTGTDTDSSHSTAQRLLDAIAFNFGSLYGNNKTAEALLELCQKLKHQVGYDPITHARTFFANNDKNNNDKDNKKCIHRFAFNSVKKQGSVVIRTPEGSIVHYVIGGAELVFQRCNSVLMDGGKKSQLTVELRKLYDSAIVESSVQGFRTLCCAYSERSTNWSELPHAAPEDALTLIGVIGIMEPLREEVPQAIRICKEAGIRVTMVTGDNLSTAMNIAQRCGLMTHESGTAMEGVIFREMSDEDLVDNILDNLVVLARATPLDKKRLIHLLARNPLEVVAVTGDGTNDAPALKAADVGFSMNSGSDIAKQASDIVLMDDNFVGVVKATMWGRNVRDNIRKFLQFQLTVNLVACVTAFCGALFNSQNMSPLKPVQLLWLNLIMDTLAALALATELPHEKTLLSRPPERKNAGIITIHMWTNVAIQSSYQLLVQIFLLVFAHKLIFHVNYFGDLHLTIVFNCFVLLQVFNFFNARLITGEHGITHNWKHSFTLFYIVLLVFITQVAIVQRGGKFMSTVPLDFPQWCYCMGFGVSALPVGSFIRWCQRSRQFAATRATLLSKVGYLFGKVVPQGLMKEAAPRKD